jgi:hypothetical protein
MLAGHDCLMLAIYVVRVHDSASDRMAARLGISTMVGALSKPWKLSFLTIW